MPRIHPLGTSQDYAERHAHHAMKIAEDAEEEAYEQAKRLESYEFWEGELRRASRRRSSRCINHAEEGLSRKLRARHPEEGLSIKGG